jgi:hypothetical protein
LPVLLAAQRSEHNPVGVLGPVGTVFTFVYNDDNQHAPATAWWDRAQRIEQRFALPVRGDRDQSGVREPALYEERRKPRLGFGVPFEVFA